MNARKSLGAMVAAATLVTGLSAAPASARHHYDRGYGYDYGYDDGYSYHDRRDYRYDRRYRGSRCDRGTGGTVIGAVAGGLAGREIARRGNRTEGAIIGAAVGALAGRAIDKADSNCRRRYR